MDKSIFDVAYDRQGTSAIKFKKHPRLESDKNIIPMWIADMDFKAPQQVVDAITLSAQHGIYGYTDKDNSYNEIVSSWYKNRMDWEINPNSIIQTPGVMFAIAGAIRALTDVGDSVMICQPVYFPFKSIILENKRNLVVSDLVLNNGRYEMDFDDIENKIKKENVKIFLLCSPHNPVGRVWSREELITLGEICLKHNVTIISDEIHSDFVYQGNKHIPIASISDELKNNVITCTAPTKTFNLAGIQSSNIIIANDDIRNAVNKSCVATGYSHLNTMAYTATKVAYQYGSEWVDTLLEYLEDNIELLNDGLKDTPISLIKPEGTYLMWLDCRKMNLSEREIESFFFEKAGLWLHNGFTFGKSGSGFVRMNIATQKSNITEALQRIQNAF
jgi:cystathionine beta-lyase